MSLPQVRINLQLSQELTDVQDLRRLVTQPKTAEYATVYREQIKS